tara:strand:- start:265 stop:480 length:216 start_codon:yes stop_codon:yes gene_type:complete
MDKAVAYLQAAHPWLEYGQAVALVVDSYKRHNPQSKYSCIGKALMRVDVGIFARETKHQVLNRLAVIREWQ